MLHIDQSIEIDRLSKTPTFGLERLQAENSMKIDIHAHFVDPLFYDELAQLPGIVVRNDNDGRQDLRLGSTTFMWRKAEWFATDHCVRDMDAKAIDIRLLSLSAPNVHAFEPARQADLARRLNDKLLARCGTYPDRLRALCCLPLADIDAALAELDRVRSHPLFSGIAMGSSNGRVPLNHHSLEPLWARLNVLRVPVVEHPMYPANTDGLDEYELPIRVGFMYETTTALTRMIYGGVFERYPDFPYIVAHTGAALLMLIERLDNGYRIFPDCRRDITRLPSEFIRGLYFDTCVFAKEPLMMAHRLIGQDRLLFGTDYPYIDTGSRHVDELPVSDQDRQAILGGNAERIFNLSRNGK
jgi:aminocarboxymuconate-semialdehyde decarboxylase